MLFHSDTVKAFFTTLHLSNSLPWGAAPLSEWSQSQHRGSLHCWKLDARGCRKHSFLTESRYTALRKPLKLKNMPCLSGWGTKPKSGEEAAQRRRAEGIPVLSVFSPKPWPLSFKLSEITCYGLNLMLSPPCKYWIKSTMGGTPTSDKTFATLTPSLLKTSLIHT